MSERSENNFDFLRLVFSSAVILSHSFPLTGKDEFFASITNGQLGLGSLSVDIFFILSGYLIFTSLKYSKTIKNYIWKRILRLYPALIILMLISLAILPFLYKGNSIFSEKEYWTYLPNNLSLYRVQFPINGIFESNPYPKTINGSLWSLSYEFTMYIVLVLLFPFKKSKYIFYIVLLCFIASYSLYIFKPNFLSKLFNYIYLDTKELYRLSTYFLAGSLLYFVKFEKFNNLYTRISLLILLLLSLYFTQFKVIAPLTLPVLILLIGTLKTKYISNIGEKFGDISYGVYIYGFLVQQIFMNYLNLNVIELTIYSIIITYFLAYLSWHYVEKPMQKYKNLV